MQSDCEKQTNSTVRNESNVNSSVVSVDHKIPEANETESMMKCMEEMRSGLSTINEDLLVTKQENDSASTTCHKADTPVAIQDVLQVKSGGTLGGTPSQSVDSTSKVSSGDVKKSIVSVTSSVRRNLDTSGELDGLSPQKQEKSVTVVTATNSVEKNLSQNVLDIKSAPSDNLKSGCIETLKQTSIVSTKVDTSKVTQSKSLKAVEKTVKPKDGGSSRLPSSSKSSVATTAMSSNNHSENNHGSGNNASSVKSTFLKASSSPTDQLKEEKCSTSLVSPHKHLSSTPVASQNKHSTGSQRTSQNKHVSGTPTQNKHITGTPVTSQNMHATSIPVTAQNKQISDNPVTTQNKHISGTLVTTQSKHISGSHSVATPNKNNTGSLTVAAGTKTSSGAQVDTTHARSTGNAGSTPGKHTSVGQAAASSKKHVTGSTATSSLNKHASGTVSQSGLTPSSKRHAGSHSTATPNKPEGHAGVKPNRTSSGSICAKTEVAQNVGTNDSTIVNKEANGSSSSTSTASNVNVLNKGSCTNRSQFADKMSATKSIKSSSGASATTASVSSSRIKPNLGTDRTASNISKQSDVNIGTGGEKRKLPGSSTSDKDAPRSKIRAVEAPESGLPIRPLSETALVTPVGFLVSSSNESVLENEEK